jgi:acetolactate synthase I/II/III large subunit
MRVSDYVANFLKKINVDCVFAITGSGSIRLIESADQAGIRYVCPHHEQAGIMASLTKMRTDNKPAVMMVTGGPGASNTLISIADAYLDSLPLFIIAGQENLEYVYPQNNMRGKGVQGLDMVDITKSVTKYGVTVIDPKDIRYVLEKAYYLAYTGRPGPVWIEIPQNLQHATVDPETLVGFVPEVSIKTNFDLQAQQTIDLIKQAERPLLWIGHGVRLSGAEQRIRKLLDTMGVPALVTWQAADLVPNDHPLFVGRAGTYGQRFANLALQNCDLLITLGTRIALPQRGFNDANFSRASKKVIVEIDPVELEKFKFDIDVPVLGDVSDFIDSMLVALSHNKIDNTFTEWKNKIHHWQHKYPMAQAPKDVNQVGVNSYWFIDRLSEFLEPNHLIVTDMGTSLTCTHAAIRLKEGQRIMTSTGLGEMGFGLPGAIGAALGAANRRVVLVTGEGGLMMNLQELQTLKHLGLDIKIFIINNNGYLTIKHTHNAIYNSQGNASACGTNSGVTFPDLGRVVSAFGFDYTVKDTAEDLDRWIENVLARKGTYVAEVKMPEFQELVPKSAVKTRPDGSMYSSPLEDLYPFLPAEELKSEMIVPLIENL